MNELPPWYTVGTVGLAGAFGAAAAAAWGGLWPYGAPDIFAFAALCAAVALAGIWDTFRAMTSTASDAGAALVELVVGGALALLLTRHFLPLVVALTLLVLVRIYTGRLTRVMLRLWDAPNPELARKVRHTFMGTALWLGLAIGILLVWSGLDHAPGLLAWRTAPVVLLAGVCGLVLVSGSEYEVMRTRFRGGQVQSDASFGTGWWGPVAGLIAAVVILAALLPPLPSVISLHTIGHTVVQVSERTTPSAAPQVVTTTSTKPGPVAKILPRQVRQSFGTYLFFFLLAVLAVLVVVRLVLAARRLGLGAADILARYSAGAVEGTRSAWALFAGLYALVRQGLRDGDWRALTRLLRQWWRWLVEAILAGLRRGNVWSQLGIRATSGRAGAAFAAAAGPRTLAGAAWNLAPGDPRRRVRETYRRFLQQGREAGLPRRPGQSPRTYERAVRSAEPGAEVGLSDLTGAYEQARFSPHPVGADDIARADGGWQRIAGFFSRRQERERSAAAAGAQGSERTVERGAQVRVRPDAKRRT